MRWNKLGQIFEANNQSEWMVSGGRTPVPMLIGDGLFRIFFAAYDAIGRGRIFSLDIDIEKPTTPFNIITDPILDLGAIGCFDDNGIIPSDLIQVDDVIYLYTIGFSIKNKLIFDAATGLAISHDGGKSFQKFSGPVIDRGVDDPCFAASPNVHHQDGLWRMWYVSCDHWDVDGNGYKHYYNIKHKTSSDGIYWSPKSTKCIDYANEFEYAISRPSVLGNDLEGYRMWYSFRASREISTYRIGFAKSRDGLSWKREDFNAGIDISNAGWDSEMICYPKVFEYGQNTYMLYNGNGYGRSGFGIAVLDDD